MNSAPVSAGRSRVVVVGAAWALLAFASLFADDLRILRRFDVQFAWQFGGAALACWAAALWYDSRFWRALSGGAVTFVAAERALALGTTDPVLWVGVAAWAYILVLQLFLWPHLLPAPLELRELVEQANGEGGA